ncbi:MAG TPA: hypothetical protein VFJ43_14015, partial [Bacteroidia bacterium]|nr:hypothetical protein [Bacteroidia bacterium]
MKRLLVISLLLLSGRIAFSQVADTSFWIPNGPVNALLLRDSLLYVGGDFNQFSPEVGHFVALDSSTASVVPPFPFVNGNINCMVRDSHGYTYVAGKFSRVGNYNRSGLFRLTPQGNFDPAFDYDVDNEIYSMAIYDDTLYVGGDFSLFAGYARGNMAAVALLTDSATSVYYDSLLEFNPNSDGPVYAIHRDTLFHKLIVGGDFSHIGGGFIAFLGKLSFPNGNCFPAATPWTSIPQVFGPVRAIATRSDKIYVAGDFDGFATTYRKGIGVLDLGGHVLTLDIPTGYTYNAGLNGHVRSMQFVDNKLYIGGDFTLASGHIRRYLACLDTFLNLLPWNPNADGRVYDLEPWDSTTICVGGEFHKVGADTCYYAALVDLDSLGTVHSWNPEFDGAVYAMLPDSTTGRIWTGGDF